MDNNIPTFTPPVPTFTPPSNSGGNGNSCHFHHNERAVTVCAKCGKPLCQDCAETYQVAIGEYAGAALCYDCCQELVAENVQTLKKQRYSITINFIATIIGVIIGFVIGGPIGGAIGGCFWTFIKCFFARFFAGIKGGGFNLISIIVSFFVSFIIEAVCSIVRTIKKIASSIKHLIQTSGFIKSDTEALQNMKDYMEYTLIRSQNVGVDLATLMNEDSTLQNNAFAQNVLRNGEEQAEASIRNCVTSINENGEIIRNFAA
ncbi:MAG: B-box zinc finger protein [Clostridia bacterium]|nr:B-box zinc finger protein [Clostridia bacterium]